MYLTIILLPFMGSIFVGIQGRKMGSIGASIITTGCIISSCVLSWIALFEVVLNRSPIWIGIFDWVNVIPASFSLQWAFYFDDLSVIICVVVLTVSSNLIPFLAYQFLGINGYRV